MIISTKIEKLMQGSSWIRKMFEEGAKLRLEYGQNVICDFTLGNPIVDPPENFFKSLINTANTYTPSIHGYMQNAGFQFVREAVASYLTKEHGITFLPDHIVMSVGAAGGLNTVLKAILDPGDEVIIFSPYFPEYYFYVDNHNGIPVILDTDENFDLPFDNLSKTINQKTRAIILNNPNNPTGRLYFEEDLKKLGEILKGKEKEFNREIFLIADEPYSKIVYDGLKAPSIFKIYENSISVTSHSKDLSIPGERIGYITINPNMKDSLYLSKTLSFTIRILGYVNAPAFMQRVVQNLQGVSVPIEYYQERRDFLYNNLTSLGYKIRKPEGAFYLFPKSPIEDDMKFVMELKEQKILVTPGRGFGRPSYFRIAYCVDFDTIKRSIDGFKELAQKYLK